MMEVHKNIEPDLVEQILLTLPPKSLMRFKCVSERWYALITDPRFVLKHLSVSKLNNRSSPSILLKRLVHKNNNTDSETEKVFSLLKLRNNTDVDNDSDEGDEHSFVKGVEDIDIPLSLSLRTAGSSLHIVGHCNGIICLVPALSGQVILWNPAIHEFKPLPPQPYLPDSPEIVGPPLPGWPEDLPLNIHREYMDNLGFGYDPRSNDYKVVNIGYPGVESSSDEYNINLPLKTAVYTLSTDSWREMKSFSLETESTILLPDRFQVYFKGMCYWSGYELPKELHALDSMEEMFISEFLILFDMGEEVFHEMLLPDSLYDPSAYCFNYHLLVWNESIALFGLRNDGSLYGESFGIWVRDEFDGLKSPWTKHVSFELIEKPLAFLKHDEILMADTQNTKGHIFSYNLSTKKRKYLPIQSMQDDSKVVVYDNYSMGGSSHLEYSSFPSSVVGNEWHSYSVWAIPPDDVSVRIKKVMDGLRSEFGGPEIEPHMTMVWSVRMKHVDVLDKFRALESRVTSRYKAKVKQVVTRSFYYQCVSLVIDSSFSHVDESFELWKATGSCGMHFGSENSVKPQVSLLYGNLTGEERIKAQEKVRILDGSITSMSFPITQLALYKIDYKDKTLKSWEKVAEYTLR